MKHLTSKLLAITLLLFISSCSKDNEEVINPQRELTEFDLEVISYFKEVALGFENGGATEITRKWNVPMKIFIAGKPLASLRDKVDKTVNEINQLATDGFTVEIVENETLSNCYMYFGTRSEYFKIFPDAETDVGSSYGYFNVWWNGNNRINNARIFIDTERPTLMQQESVVLEEITQALGLGKDSPRYPSSIFYETLTWGGYATEYSPLDREIIRLLYHPDMRAGLHEDLADLVLRNILQNEL